MEDSSSLNQTPEQRARDEINEYNPRIAVTVDMTATSTDLKPLECILLHARHKKLSEEEIRAEFFKKEKQTTLFGDDEITRTIRNPIQHIANLYIRQLHTIWRYVTETPLMLSNSRNVPIYHFVFASNNAAAKNIARDIIIKS